MPPLRLGPQDLLEYDSSYGVLICRKCQYAIQKSAVQSHLLRHKIYRDERQHLLASIEQLDLLEPDDVCLPTSASPPIDALPTIAGFCCTASGCGNLCASSKRMKRHRSDVHGFNKSCDLATYARPAKLQTFFRGTKLRYFEVFSSTTDGSSTDANLPAAISGANEKEAHERCNKEGFNKEVLDVHRLARFRTKHSTTLPEVRLKASPVNLDLQTLTYFHHFLNATSLTLAGAEHTSHIYHYWQTRAIQLALQQEWLMCGLLGISAYHLATLTDDDDSRQAHRHRSTQFRDEFSTGLDATTLQSTVADNSRIEELKRAGVQILSILRCAHWALDEYTLDRNNNSDTASTPPLISIITNIRSLELCELGLGGSETGDKDSFARASRILRTTDSSIGSYASQDGKLSPILNALSMLPSQMMEPLGRPKSTHDVFAVLSGIAALVESTVTSFADPSASSTIRGVTMWLNRVSADFNLMIQDEKPGALVVVAHWAAALVKRAEDCGCWYLKGAAKAILLQIVELVPLYNFKLLALVISSFNQTRSTQDLDEIMVDNFPPI